MSKTLLSIFIATIIGLSINLYLDYKKQWVKADLNEELKKVATPNYLEKRIILSLSNKKIDDAIMYKNLANYLNIDINQTITQQIKEKNTLVAKSWRNTKNFSKSFITGKSENIAGLTGSVLSDMLVVGDIRDVYTEGKKLTQDKPYDKLTLGLATIGLGFTVATVVTAGTTLAPKVGISVMKVANKTRKLSKKFSKLLKSKLVQTVDFEKIKKIDYSSIESIKKSSKKTLKAINITNMQNMLTDINKINTNTSSIMDSVKIMKYIDNEKDLSKVVKLSQKFKKNTAAVLKVLGKGALKSGKLVAKYTSLFITQVVLLLLSIFAFIGLLLSKYYIYRVAKKLID